MPPKIGPLGLSPNKIGEGITKETAKDWKGLRVTIKLTVQNRQAKVSVVPSTVVLVIKALKDLPSMEAEFLLTRLHMLYSLFVFSNMIGIVMLNNGRLAFVVKATRVGGYHGAGVAACRLPIGRGNHRTRMAGWKFLGGLPPMSDEEWLLKFEKYKLSTEYKSELTRMLDWLLPMADFSLRCRKLFPYTKKDDDPHIYYFVIQPDAKQYKGKIVLVGAMVWYLSWLWTSFHFHEKNVKASVLCSSWIIGALWEYYTSMYIVNTQRPYFLDIDFGSVFTWLQCDAPYTNCAKVDFFFRSSIPGIFAIGDVAAFPLKMYDIVCMPNIHFKSLYRCRCQSKVWAIADSKRQGYLGFGEFVAAMQSGMEKGGSEMSLACSMWQAHVPSEIPKIKPDSDLLKRVEIKTREQIERMRETCGVAREVLDAAARVIKPGITTDEIDRVVPEETIARGSILPFGMYCYAVMDRVVEVLRILHSLANAHWQIGELEQSETGELNQYEQPAGLASSYGDPQSNAHMRNQVAGQDIKIMEADDFMDEKTFTLLKGLITGNRISLPYYEGNYQLNLLNYVSEDGNDIPASTNPTIVNVHRKTWDMSQSCDLLGSSLTENVLPFNFDASAGTLTNYVTLDNFMPMNELTVTSGRYGELHSVEKTEEDSIAFDAANSFGETATMHFNNVELFHWLGQQLTDPLPDLTDLTDMDPISNLQIAPARRKNITLVLDLDETLIHSSATDCNGADFSFLMCLGTKEHTVYVKKRPYVDTFLQKVSEMFEVVIFTASLSSYANQLLDMLDPENRLISWRFFRESCLSLDGSYIKDLTFIVADLAKVAIIDNTPEVFQLQVDNGIPIKSWSSDPADLSLLELIPFLETLAVADDVRPIIAKMFGTQRSTI
ncbi:hypothetical protein ABZP36_028999 [Zizania latifolia]